MTIRRRRPRLVRLLLAGATFAAIGAPAANASQLIGRDATGVHLQVNQGQALVTFRSGGAAKHVLVWGAVNAMPPQPTGHQVKFRVDYSGRGFTGGTCRPYTGQPLTWAVAQCDGPDGSHWAAQSFPQPLPDLGFTPWTASQRQMWLNVSHWTGSVPELTVGQDWVYGGKFREIYGQLKFLGVPVFGFKTSRFGVPLGGFGTLIYLDVLDAPAYGPGWHRENSFVPHKNSGGFCYGFYTFDPTKGGYQHPAGATARRGPGVGAQYRITAHGPGVAPDVTWTGPALAAYAPTPENRQLELNALNQIQSWGDGSCTAGHSDF